MVARPTTSSVFQGSRKNRPDSMYRPLISSRKGLESLTVAVSVRRAGVERESILYGWSDAEEDRPPIIGREADWIAALRKHRRAGAHGGKRTAQKRQPEAAFLRIPPGRYYEALRVPTVRAKRARNFSTRPVSTMRVWAPVRSEEHTSELQSR